MIGHPGRGAQPPAGLAGSRRRRACSRCGGALRPSARARIPGNCLRWPGRAFRLSARARNFAAVALATGVPWPGASTCGSSRASAATDCFAAGQFQVEIHGGPETRCLNRSRSHKELKLRVSTASPVIKTRSPGLKKRHVPGVWPGVGMHSQSGSPGTPASGLKACAASVMLAFAAIRAARRGMRRISGPISHRPIGSPNSGRYFPAASGSSPGCMYTGRSQLRASSSAEPA
jgi:hypothetical protein